MAGANGESVQDPTTQVGGAAQETAADLKGKGKAVALADEEMKDTAMEEDDGDDDDEETGADVS